jgi:phage terminase large subunit
MDIEYNPLYDYIMHSKARVIVNYGGRDSGKSYYVGGQYIPLKMLNEKYFRGMVCKETYTSCKDSVYKEITDGISHIQREHRFNCIQHPLEIRCNNGNNLIFRGMDNPSNLKSIKGINFVWFKKSDHNKPS